jgi:hypothetical protein
LFTEVCASDDEKIVIEALLELAKMHEHKFKDVYSARDFCLKAIEINKNLREKGELAGMLSFEQLQSRLRRLEKKLAKFPR